MDSEHNCPGHDLPDITGLLRAFKRRSWISGGLAATALSEWFPAIQNFQPIPHYVGFGLATVLAADLLGGGLIKAYRALRRRVVIIDFTDRQPKY